jgi:hypothetical protein
MDTPNFNTLLNFFKVLANENRLKLVGILSQAECSVEDLAARLKLKEPTVSHHLMKLKELNLVEMRSQGNIHLYKLNGDTLSNLNKSLFTSEQMANCYINGDRIIEIPASRKKRLIILKWLVNKFELGLTYSEKEVNQIIKRHHPDSATLRREFIGYNLMKREQGIYERLTENLWKDEREIMKQN